MKTDTVNTEKWKLYSKENAALIVAAVNACKEINPDNPLNVAKYITAMFNRLKEISEKTDKWDTTKNILYNITK